MALSLVLCALVVAWPAGAQQPDSPLRLLGEFSFESKTEFEGTVVGGLSGLTYDPRRDVYYAVSDDRGEFQAPRFYTLRIPIGLDGIGDVQILSVTTLDSDANTPGIQPYELNESDLEEIILTPDDELLISSERDGAGKPWIRRFALDGTLLGELPVPDKFNPMVQTNAEGRDVIVRGVRTNLGFEAMALSPDARTLVVSNEEALAQDGPIATVTAGTNVRIIRYDLSGEDARPTAEFIYRTDPIFATPNPPTAFADNGVSGMLWIQHVLPRFEVLALERSFSSSVGNDVSIYGVTIGGAQNVASLESLPVPFTGRMTTKTLLVNIGALGLQADNLEALALSPKLPNGRQSLIVMSDDNFSAFTPPQVNQFILFEVAGAIGK